MHIELGGRILKSRIENGVRIIEEMDNLTISFVHSNPQESNMAQYDGAEAEDDFGMKKEPQIVYRLPSRSRVLFLELAGYLRLCESRMGSASEAKELGEKIQKHLQDNPE